VLGRVLAWLDERTGYRAVFEAALDEPVRGGASWAYVFGSVLTFILLLQAGTGVLLAMYYSPSATDAWASVAYLQDQVAMGWFIRGLHSHGASAMVVVTGLHLFQVALYGAYKKPREVNWLVGVMMLGLVLAFALTGYLLPWDQKGYWATKVATGIMGSAPVVGQAMQRFVQGGNEYGNLTLTRFYSIHVFILPATIFLLVVIHVALFRKHGVTPKWGRSDAELARTTQPFWPDQLFMDVVAMFVVFAFLVMITWMGHGVPLEAPADPASGYDARPEWYFLPLFEMLKYFHGPMEQVVSLGAPLVVFGFLALLPFVDRGADRSPKLRIKFLAVLGTGLAATVVLIVLAKQSDGRDKALQARIHAAEAQALRARELARAGVPTAGGTAVYENEPFFAERKLFGERCAGCHVGNERKGPLLAAGYNSRAWIRQFLANPDAPENYGLTKDIHGMKPVKYQGAELDALVEFVYSQSGPPDLDAKLTAQGKNLFLNEGPCSDCHSADWETTGEEGPNLGRRGSVEWLAAFIAEPGHPRFFGAKNEMQAFKGKLSDAQIAGLATYVLSWRDTATMAATAATASRP
jgi:ubiquinol-cytochrome c reductase cytochrome b subunit